MKDLGDRREDAVLTFRWATYDKDGGSINPTTAGAIKVYRSDGTVITSGITDTRAVGGITGVHQCSIDLGAHVNYSIDYDYIVQLEGAIIDGETVNTVLATFSIQNRFAGSSLFQKAAKVLTNKAVQNKNTGAVNYYDDDGQTVILTHTPRDEEETITRTPS